jgi:7-cyano-7-deazaguanine synthase
MQHERSAIVLFSGGQDSTTCLGWALEQFDKVYTIGFNYGQRHSIEMNCRPIILEKIKAVKETWEKKLASDKIITFDFLEDICNTALTNSSLDIATDSTGLPNTFVPGRNLLFLNATAAYAYTCGISDIIMGVCQTDYSGYPDCRDDTIKAMQIALNLGMDAHFRIHTPLMWTDKAATWRLAESLGGEQFIDIIIEHTHTCYNGDRSHRTPWGYGCGDCPACALRSKGYYKYKSLE